MNMFYMAVAFGGTGAVILFGLVRIFRCKHHWDLVDKTEMESRLETVMKATGKFPYAYSDEVPRAAYRRVVLALRCSKCGQAQIHKIDSA